MHFQRLSQGRRENSAMSRPLVTPSTLRLFLALWPDDRIRTGVTQWQQAWSWPSHAALVQPQRLHLTLHFLGDVPADRLTGLKGQLRVTFEPLALHLGQGEVWPHGVAVLRPEHTPTELTRLHGALADALVAASLPVDAREYRPHVTLARRASGAKAPAEGPGLRWHARQGYVLARSLPGGAGYEVLERFG